MLKKYLLSSVTIIVVMATGPLLSTIQAGEHHHHDAHVHGVAHLNVALEGNDLYIELTSPAANIVGFEHDPRTQNQEGAVQEAIKQLKKGPRLFIQSSGAACQMVEAKVDTDMEGHNGHDTEPEYTNQSHKADAHSSHAEFVAEYHFVCKKPEKLAQMDVKLLEIFPGIEHIVVQLLTETKQTAVKLTEKSHKIKF